MKYISRKKFWAKRTNRRIRLSPIVCAFALILCGSIAIVSFAQRKDVKFKIINPYQTVKKYPYKASLHNHSSFHPEYTHASESPGKRLKDYRDYDTEPLYGIVAITDHSRLTTPLNTVPPGWNKEGDAPWGIGNILWIPGNESNIGNVKKGGVFGDLVIVNAQTTQLSTIDWTISETSAAQSGWIYTSVEIPASVELKFSGTGFKWIACKESEGGTAVVFVDGKNVGEADFYSPETTYKQEIFSMNGLSAGEHLLRLVYDRKGSSSSAKYMGRINLDMVVTMQTTSAEVRYGADHPALSYRPLKYEYMAHPNGEGRGVEKAFKKLSEGGCFLVLAHPNARLEEKGEHAGTQLWTSAGYTYAELDSIFGNKAKGIKAFEYLPHALEIGNQGYDFSNRSGYKNAEEKWDYLLTLGHRIMGTASDDSHGQVPFRGWVVIFTSAPTRDKLTKEDVMESLFAGNFYASQGPVMQIDVKDNRITIRADKPSLIEFISKGNVIFRKENSLAATYAVQGDELYVRARITRQDDGWKNIKDGCGKTRSAWTNPIYVVSENH